jgi:hypothetical protein
LWAAAVELAREYGVNKTARALGLDYYSLKRRLESGTHPGLYEPKGGAPFIELVTPLGNSSAECIVGNGVASCILTIAAASASLDGIDPIAVRLFIFMQLEARACINE